MDVHLEIPVFSESWRALSRVPYDSWPAVGAMTMDSLALDAAQSASVGEVWFSWATSLDDAAEAKRRTAIDVREAMRDAPELVAELARTVEEARIESSGAESVFGEQLDWDRQSPLGRRILNYLAAPLVRPRPGEAWATLVLEDLSLRFGMPLPVIAETVRRLAKGAVEPEDAPRDPGGAPWGGELSDLTRRDGNQPETVYA
jgi:hypothetical protein